MKLLIAFAAFASLACGQEDSPAPAPGASGTLLIGNKGEDTLSFVDLATGAELGRAATGRMPHEIAVSPDGRQAAVVAYGGSTIDIFDVATRAKLRTIELAPNQGPHGIAWLADGRIVATAERSQSLVIVDTGRNDAVRAIPTGQQGTHMVVVAPDGRRAFTANIGSGTVSVLDLEAGAKIRDIMVGGRPEGIALSPDGRTLWVGDLAGARVQAFETAGFERVAEVGTGPVPIRVLASPDGRWIVTSNLGDGSLTVIDARTRARVREIALSGPRRPGRSPSSSRRTAGGSTRPRPGATRSPRWIWRAAGCCAGSPPGRRATASPSRLRPAVKSMNSGGEEVAGRRGDPGGGHRIVAGRKVAPVADQEGGM